MYKDEIDALYVLEQVVSSGPPLVSVNLKSEIRYIPHSTVTFRKDWALRNWVNDEFFRKVEALYK